jgi:N-acetylglucosaminyldiphosphoundecaprenol N-acetyl-beta-D-mannosaminyltransferase
MTNLFERKTCRVIDVSVDIGNLAGIAQNIINAVSKPESFGGYICVANVHMLTVAHENPRFKDVLVQANLTIPDGMPLVWTQKLKGHKDAERVCGPDLMLELCRLASDNHQAIFLLGGSPKTLELLAEKLKNQFPKLLIAGKHSPELLPEEPSMDINLIEQINHSGASILFVGLGCPKQEFWCATHAPHLKPISIGVGAAFDFHAGTKKRPPLWVQKSGLEWLYRLISEPKRLWKRYLVSNTKFLQLSLKDFWDKNT